jgi:cytochrome P450
VRRDPNPHVGFGGPGPHFCLGAHLARRELSVVFRQLLTRLARHRGVGEPVPLDAMGVPLVGGIKRLPVRFTPTKRVMPSHLSSSPRTPLANHAFHEVYLL